MVAVVIIQGMVSVLPCHPVEISVTTMDVMEVDAVECLRVALDWELLLLVRQQDGTILMGSVPNFSNRLASVDHFVAVFSLLM